MKKIILLYREGAEISARKFYPGGGHCGGYFIQRLMAEIIFLQISKKVS